MPIAALLMAGFLGYAPPAEPVRTDHDRRPPAGDRSAAIREAARSFSAVAPPPEATSTRYPSADGDILAGLGPSIVVPPLPPWPGRQAAAARSADLEGSDVSATGDTSTLLGGPK